MQKKRVYTIIEANKNIRYYCSVQERCRWDVKQKLLVWGIVDNLIPNIIMKLIDDDYINEERYARAFCRGKFRIKKWGRKKIEFELKKKYLSDDHINIGMEEIKSSEYLEELERQIDKKNNLIKEKSFFNKRNILASYLIDRGFEAQLVWNSINRRYK